MTKDEMIEDLTKTVKLLAEKVEALQDINYELQWQLNTRDEWINIRDRLPEEDGFYWVCVKPDPDEVSNEVVHCTGFYFTETKLFDTQYFEFPVVTHWKEYSIDKS